MRPLAVTRLRFVLAPALAGFTYARFCVPETTQKSLSPQTKSRISSVSGRMMSVVNRTFALTRTTAWASYATSRVVWAAAGTDTVKRLTTKNTKDTKAIGVEGPDDSAHEKSPLTRGGQPLRIGGGVVVHGKRGRVDGEVDHLRDVGTFEQGLPVRLQLRNAERLDVIEVKELTGPVGVQVGIGQEELGRTALDDRAQEVPVGEIVATLRGEDHGGVPLAPGLERVGDVGLDLRVAGEPPGLVQEEELQGRIGRAVLDGGVRPMEDVEEQRLEDERKVIEAFEIEALNALERERVGGIVKERGVGTALDPAMEVLGQGVRQHGGDRDQAALGRLDFIDVFDRVVKLTVVVLCELVLVSRFDEHAEQGKQEVQVFVGLGQAERVDRELTVREADLPDAAPEVTGEALVAPPEVENHRRRVVLLRVGDDEVAEKGLAGAGGALNERMADVLVVEVPKVRRVVVGLKDG